MTGMVLAVFKLWLEFFEQLLQKNHEKSPPVRRA
jgi:hypothetical protein